MLIFLFACIVRKYCYNLHRDYTCYCKRILITSGFRRTLPVNKIFLLCNNCSRDAVNNALIDDLKLDTVHGFLQTDCKDEYVEHQGPFYLCETIFFSCRRDRVAFEWQIVSNESLSKRLLSVNQAKISSIHWFLSSKMKATLLNSVEYFRKLSSSDYHAKFARM